MRVLASDMHEQKKKPEREKMDDGDITR
jgi:hypothetical protein